MSTSLQPGRGASKSTLRPATATSEPSVPNTAALTIVLPLSIPSRYCFIAMLLELDLPDEET